MIFYRFVTIFVLVSLWLSTAGASPAAGQSTAAPAAPAAFNKTEPANNATGVNTTVTLKWAASITPGTTYEVCVLTKNMCPNGRFKSVGTNTSLTVSLQAQTTYYWQVRAIAPDRSQTLAGGGLWKFTTVAAPPTAFNKVSPANNTTNAPLSVALSWTVSSGRQVRYAVCYDTSNNNTCDTGWSQPIAGTAYTISGLNNDTSYYWQVRAFNANGTVYANSGSWWTFRTRIAPPGAFVKIAPALNDFDVPLNVILSWSASAGTNLSYRYCIDKEAVNNNLCDSAWVTTAAALSAAPAGLQYGQNYSWQVQAVNSSGTVDADNGVWGAFATLPTPPTGFTKLSPHDGAAHTALNPVLYWSSSAGTGITYEYCLKANALNAACLPADYISAGAGTSLAISTALNRDQEYIWQVRARDASNQLQYAGGSEADVWHFTTLPEPPVVDAARLLFDSPEDEVLAEHVGASTTSGLGLTFALAGRAPAGQSFVFNSDGTFTYTPAQDFNGSVTFQFTVSDGVNPPAAPATVTINVTPVNDRPVFSGDFGEVKVYNFTYPSDSDIYLFIETADADLPYGDSLTITPVSAAAVGTLTYITDPTSHVTSADFSWPAAVWDAGSPYSFTLRVTDAQGLSSDLTFVITLEPPQAGVSYSVFMPAITR